MNMASQKLSLDIESKSICQIINDKLVAHNNKADDCSDISSNVSLKDSQVLGKRVMSFDELLELVSYCIKANPESLTENQRTNVLAFVETLEIAEDEEERNFLRRCGEYLENEWCPVEYLPANENEQTEKSKKFQKCSTSKDTTEFIHPEINNLKSLCPSPASVDLEEEECSRMKEYRNLFEKSPRLRTETSLFKADAALDSLDLIKCLHLPPKYNKMSKPIPMKLIPCIDTDENEVDSLEFVDTFQFQEWKDEEYPSHGKPCRLKRSDEKAKVAQQMISYVHEIENNRYPEGVPEVFQRFWLETNDALGIESNNMSNEMEIRENTSSTTDEEDLSVDVLDNDQSNSVETASNTREREQDDSLSFSAWNAVTSSNIMTTFPLRQNEQQETNSSDDEDFMDFFMGREASSNVDDRLGLPRTDTTRSIPDFLERYTSDSSQNSTLINGLSEDDTPVPLVAYSLGTENSGIRSTGLSQSLIASIEEYMDEDDEGEGESQHSDEEVENSDADEQFEMGDMPLDEYFTSSRVFKLPNGLIPPQIEVDEENMPTGHQNKTG